MSRTIDDKVVEMQFDNAQFERGVRETMSTLEKFKQALDMSPLGSSIEAVQVKFSAFDSMVKRMLENIADSAWNTGKKLVKSLTIDQVAPGWEKFSDKTEAVQTIMSATSQTWEDSANILQRTNHLMEKGFDEIMANGIAKQYGEVANGVKSVSDAAKELGMTPEKFKAAAEGLDAITYAASHTGGQMQYVSEELEKLNWFTDETSYSFMDMVNNIGKFTSNNIPLEQAVTSMQGISTWAALSGANVTEAGRAMYNLSQAISVGAVKLMDWKSIENANMATAEFKQTAIETAVAMGTLKDKGDGTYETMKGNAVSVKDFNSALSDCWFSSEVLLKTLDKYGGFAEQMNEAAGATGLTAKVLLDYTHAMKDGTFDIEAALEEVHESEEYANVTAEDLTKIISGLADESNELGMRAFEAAQAAKTFKDVINYVKEAVGTGWMNTFELIFGNYEEAKELWSELAEEMYDIFVEAGVQRNDMLRAWKEMGGRDDLIEAFWNVFHTIKGIISAVKDAFHEIFPAMTAQRLKDVTEKLRDLTTLIGVTDKETGELNERGEKIKTVFKGVFAVFRLLKDIIVATTKPVTNLFTGVGSGLLDFGASLGDILIKYTDIIRESGILEEVTNRLGGVFSALHDFIGDVLEIFRGVSYWEGGGGIAGVFESIFDGINSAVKLFFDVFSALTGKDLSGIRDNVMNAIRKVRNFIVDGLGPISGLLDKLKDKISEAIKGVKDSFGGFKKIDMSGPNEFKSKIEKIFGPIKSLFEGIKNVFSAVWEGIKKLAPLISASIQLIGNVMSQVGNAVKDVIMNADASKLLDIINGGSMAAIGIGIATFVNNISKVGKSLAGIKDVFKSVTGFLDGIKESFQKNKQANVILKIAGAIAILAVSAYVLASIDTASLSESIFAIGILLTELTLALKFISDMDLKKARKGSKTLVTLSASVVVLALAVKMLAGLNWEELAKGLVGVTVLLGEMVIAAKLLSSGKTGKMMKGATNAVIFAAAIRVLVSSVKSLGKMDTDKIIQGMIGVSILITEMIGAAMLLSVTKTDKMMKGALNAVAFGVAIRILVSSVKSLGKMDTDKMIQGMVGVTILITEMIGAAMLLSAAANGRMMKGAANAILFAIALRLLVSSVKAIGKLDTDTLKQGLIGVGVLMAEMAAASLIMRSGGAAGMVLAAGALLIMGAAMKVVSSISWDGILKGIVAFAGFVVVVGVVSSVMSETIPYVMAFAIAMTLFGVAAAGFGIGLMAVSIALATFATAGEVAFATLVKGLEIVITAIPDLVSALASSLADSVESLATLVISIGTSLIEALRTLVPEATATLLEITLSVLTSLGENIQPIVEALLNIIVGVIQGSITGIPQIVSASIDLIKETVAVLVDALGEFSLTDILEASAMLVALNSLMPLVLGVAVEAVLATASLPLVGKNLSNFGESVTPFLELISKYDASSMQGAAALADMILLLTKADILNSLTSWFTGGDSLQEFGEELKNFGPLLKEYGDSVTGINGDDIKASAEAAKYLTEFADAVPKRGGLVAKITGENSLSDFAEELKKFGPAFADYAASVSGIKPNVIRASSSAAKTITAFADGVPKRGGFVSLITGENSLSDFAEELKDFGPAFAEYSKSIEKVKISTVTASSLAAETITAFANGVPRHDGLVQLITGENSLSDFAEELKAFGKPFVEYAKLMAKIENVSAVEASSAAAATIAKFAAIVPPSGGIVQLVTGKNDLAEFGEALKKFGPGLKEYVDSIQDLKLYKVKASADAAAYMAKVASELPETGGVKQWFTGEASLSKLGFELKRFAPGFKAYIQAMSDVSDYDSVIKASRALMFITTAISHLPPTDGIESWFTGRVSLGSFGKELASFAPDFVKYADRVSGITSDSIESSSAALKLIAEAAAALPTEGGIEKWFTGTTSLTNFGAQLESFGENFVKYVETISGANITADSFSLASKAITTLVDIAITLGKQGGIEQWWTGEYDLGYFGETLRVFGDRFKLYGAILKETDLGIISNSTSVIARVISILPENYDGGDGLVQLGVDLVTFAGNLETFASRISDMANDTPDYANIISSVTSDIQRVIDQLTTVDVSSLNAYASALGSIADNMYVHFSDSFTKHTIDIQRLSHDFVSIFIKEASARTADYEAAGKALGGRYKLGLDSEDIVTYTYQKIQQCVNAVKSFESSFEYSGKMLVLGLARGLTDPAYILKVDRASHDLGRVAIDGLNTSLAIRSPSKLTEKSAVYFIAGFANRLLKGLQLVKNNARLVGTSAITELNNSISAITEIAADEIDSNPVIRPVLDLSDIEAGVNDLDAMFSRKQAFAIGASGYDDETSTAKSRANIQFNQYNYSPKALSSIEIYRRTNNQLSKLK